MKIDAETYRMLKEMADEDGLTPSEELQKIIDDEWEKVYGKKHDEISRTEDRG